MSLEITLNRIDRIYHPGSRVSGAVVVSSKGSLSHQGITLRMDGSVQLQLSAKSVGLFEAFYNSVKPVQLVQYTIEVAKPGKLGDGVSELPFEFKLEPLPGQTLYETYHGVFVNIQYQLNCELKRGMLSKDVTKSLEFIVEQEPKPGALAEAGAGGKNGAVPFEITPASLENVKKNALKDVPDFCIVGQLDHAVWDVTEPFSGHLRVTQCAKPIKSIELQLVRVETCGCADGYAKEATEIQNIQIADGDVVRDLDIPVFMVFPRLFTCPTLATKTFKIEFEVNLVVMFHNARLITWNFPIKIVRAR